MPTNTSPRSRRLGPIAAHDAQLSDLVGSLRDERPLLILYGGRVLVLQSVLYDEYIYPNNQRMFEVVKLTLLDPLGGPPVIFDKATDDPALVEGIFEVRVGPIEPFQ